eukprot:gnl/MRDRNA2_/MRDRNA2_178096_c0_seq1.p1 gnl/MRDRNA2_/MRDRNA2_178096_c0~~gnl/MRDRNA2_/MRDRNA2_178096_c0_seq1.p1  ORF type:complete len:275 (-),score=66.92 gnl/MRDRNA2_/MRDRNA2_178096_c0_seq1:46-825(-)
MMNTTLSAATGAMVVFFLSYAITKKYDCAALCNGILAGLVSITAGCSNVESGSAVAIGAFGGCVYVGSSALLKRAMIDDPVDAFSVHGACGIWGCLAAALFDFGHSFDKHHGWGGFSATSWTEADGEVKYMTTADALTANVFECLFVINWSGGISFFLFGVLRLLGVLRVQEQKEEIGCDSECASPKAYNIVPTSSMEPSTVTVPTKGGKSSAVVPVEASPDLKEVVPAPVAVEEVPVVPAPAAVEEVPVPTDGPKSLT